MKKSTKTISYMTKDFRLRPVISRASLSLFPIIFTNTT